MNRSLRLGVIGFVIGLPFFCYLELKSDKPASAKADPAASGPTGRESTAMSQTNKESSAHARRPQQATGRAASRTPTRKTGNKPPRAKDSRGTDVRRKKADVARTPKAQQPTSAVRDINASKQRVGNQSDRQPRRTRQPEVETTHALPVARNRQCQIGLNRILVGEQVATNGILRESTLDEQAKHGKYVVYLELSITSQEQRQDISVSFQDFRLEDSAGLIYSPIQTNDRLSATLAPGKTASGGVAFAVYNDGAPARLLFRTGEESYTPLPESLFWNEAEEGSATP